MRVLMLAQFYPPVVGGEERHVRNLAAALASRGHELHVGTVATPDNPAGQRADGDVTLHCVPGLGSRLPVLYTDPERPHAFPFADPVLARGLGILVERLRPDLVHAHNWIVASYLPHQRRSRRPLVLSLHDYSDVCAVKRLMLPSGPCSGPTPLRCLRHGIAHYGLAKGPVTVGAVLSARRTHRQLVDLYLPVSQAVASGNDLDARGITYDVVPNFVPDALARTELRTRPPGLPSEPYLLFAGDLSRDKGVPTLLQAYGRLPTPRPPLLLIGRAVDVSLESLPEGVVRLEAMPHEQVIGAFQHALAAISPSIWPDPCPTTVLEAMSVGAPVVTTRTGGMVDMVVDGVSGLLVTPGDVGELSTALGRLIADPALRSALRAGAATGVRPFTASAVVDRVSAHYERLVSA